MKLVAMTSYFEGAIHAGYEGWKKDRDLHKNMQAKRDVEHKAKK